MDSFCLLGREPAGGVALVAVRAEHDRTLLEPGYFSGRPRSIFGSVYFQHVRGLLHPCGLGYRAVDIPASDEERISGGFVVSARTRTMGVGLLLRSSLRTVFGGKVQNGSI